NPHASPRQSGHRSHLPGQRRARSAAADRGAWRGGGGPGPQDPRPGHAGSPVRARAQPVDAVPPAGRAAADDHRRLGRADAQGPGGGPGGADGPRTEKERLIRVCQSAPVRLGRINALGSWGDAVLVARSARDLRGICLIPWALDPTMDVSGKRRASRLSQAEFEEKLLAFDKRLEELDEQEILAGMGPVNFERRGDLL